MRHSLSVSKKGTNAERDGKYSETARDRAGRGEDNVMISIGGPFLWAGFIALVLALLALDLIVFHRKAHAVGFREAVGWSVFWISLALLFNLFIYVQFGAKSGMEFLTGYVVEKALSVDNLFVFLMIFAYFKGALVMRAVFIFLGAALLNSFHWVVYLFGGLLLVSGIKMFLMKSDGIHPERNPLFRLFRRLIPATAEYDGHHFFTRVPSPESPGRWFATPLFLVLVCIEVSDLVFAVDSIPAIFAITRDPFIVFTSNIFAILGLRALYFVLAGSMDRFHYLKPALALILVFVGGKMMITDLYKIPIGIALSVVLFLLAAGVAFSMIFPRPKPALGAISGAVEAAHG
jgi:tellurite resistance protein TerC